MSERTALYRLFPEGSGVLYIGISKRLGARWDQHLTVQPWWPDVHRQTVEWYPDRETAERAETAAIKAECPRYNVTHNVDPDTGLPVTQRVAGNGDWRVTGRIGMTDMRGGLPELIEQVRRKRSCVFVTSRWTPRAAVIPAELGQAIEAAGGPDVALKLLRSSLHD